MDDLHNRDLSEIPEEDLSPAERRELKRRFQEFINAVGGNFKTERTTPKKRVTKWNPETHGRKH